MWFINAILLLEFVTLLLLRLAQGKPLFVADTSPVIQHVDHSVVLTSHPAVNKLLTLLPDDSTRRVEFRSMRENINIKKSVLGLPTELPNTANNLRLKGVPVQAPDYMLELYDTFLKSGYTAPNSNIVRSFRISMKEGSRLMGSRRRESSRTTLRFNISAIPAHEQVKHAELRLPNVDCEKNVHYISFPKMYVYEYYAPGYRLICSMNVCGKRRKVKTVDVSSMVRQHLRGNKFIVELHMRVQNMPWSLTAVPTDVMVFPNNASEPLIIVHSTDNSVSEEHKHDRHELVMHELTEHSPGREQYSTYIGGKPSDMYTENGSDQRLGRYKRSRGQHKSSLCRRRPMFVNFEDINWHTWIIAPRGYQAYQCAGRCYFPLTEHLTPSKHAIIQAMLHARHPRSTARACCVPTKLEPISILYVDEQGVITYKYTYDGMVVAECGCR